MKHPLNLITAICFLFLGGIVKAQDPQFTQTFSSALYANPAFTGSAGQGRVQAAQRIQWPNLSGAFYTTHLGADLTKDKFFLDIGVNYLHDRAAEGILVTNSYGLNVARSLRIYNKLSLRLGVSGSMNARNLDVSKLTFGDQIDTRYGFIYNSQAVIPFPDLRYVNFNLGAILHSDVFLLSYAIHNANRPDLTFGFEPSRLPARHVAHGSLRIFNREAKRNSKLYLNLAWTKQEDFQSYMAGASILYDNWKIGAAYRSGDAVIALLGFTSKRFTFSYSYDITVSKLTNATGGSHEFTLALYWGKMQEKRNSISWLKDLF